MSNDLDRSQLLRYAQDLQELMNQHAQLQQHHQSVLKLLQQGEIDSERLLNLALHDPLTGLPNRRHLEQELQAAMLDTGANGHNLYVLYMDLDRFKPINDTYGHDTGDQVLQEVARRLQAAVRRADIVARVGGDEFVVVLQRMQSRGIVLAIIESVLTSMKAPVVVGAYALSVGVSIGAAHHPCDGANLIDLLKHADDAMYQAKRTHAGYVFYDTLPAGTIKRRSTSRQ